MMSEAVYYGACNHAVCLGATHCCSCQCHAPEQLEFDLWVEERFSQWDVMIAANGPSLYNHLVNTHRDCEITRSLVTAHTIVRYRV